jgi:hypothetical protein
LSASIRSFILAIAVVAVGATTVQPQAPPQITSPQQQFGHEIGADYVLPNYSELTRYWQTLDRESDRMRLEEIGKTAEGRPQLMAVITAPENFRRIDRYKDIARRLALAEGLTDDEARRLAAEGKAVVWIDGGLHASEVLGAQQLMELAYQMVSRTDAETLRFLRDVILLAAQVNPDGMELVSNWYMREKDPTRRSTAGTPRLWQKYVGHDNNRDFYLVSQPESINIARVLYREWYPQIVYNHHQTGPTGTVLFAPPFRDPFNYNLDPLIPLGIDMIGAAMHSRFAAEGKPGATMRRGSNYSTWWNGGLRTAAYFHNMIGLLTESIGNPTPMTIPFVPQRQLPSGDLPYPIAPQRWRFRQSIEYSMTANRAVLDVASRYKDTLLFNIYRMGKNSIERGSTDTWTMSPTRIDEVRAAIAREQGRDEIGAFNPAATVGGSAPAAPARYYDMLRDPVSRDPRGYIVPADQADFLTATKFINTLVRVGVTVHRATAPFEVNGKRYPEGSFVVKTAQAFRPHVLDMFEPQDHPDDFAYPGGPPIPPYDNAGYTLAFQMAVKFDRVLDAFDGPFDVVRDEVKPSPGRVVETADAAGYLLSHRPNDAFIAINRLLEKQEDVYWVPGETRAGGASLGYGATFVPAKSSTLPLLRTLSRELGLDFFGVARRPAGDLIKLRPVRIGLWDQYGGSAPSGWTRWLLEQFEFPFEVVYPQGLDAGNLSSRFDVLIFPTDAIPQPEGWRPTASERQPSANSIPPEFRPWLGTVSVATTLPRLKTFVQSGGTIVAVGSSTSLFEYFDLPIERALVDTSSGLERELPRETFYVPGSVLQARVHNEQPLAWGMDTTVDVFFDQSPAFKPQPDAALKGTNTVAWFDTARPLRSGWAWGQQYLRDTVAVADARLGKGRVFLFGPEITFRGQPHGTFKFLFNAIYYGPAVAGQSPAVGH